MAEGTRKVSKVNSNKKNYRPSNKNNQNKNYSNSHKKSNSSNYKKSNNNSTYKKKNSTKTSQYKNTNKKYNNNYHKKRNNYGQPKVSKEETVEKVDLEEYVFVPTREEEIASILEDTFVDEKDIPKDVVVPENHEEEMASILEDTVVEEPIPEYVEEKTEEVPETPIQDVVVPETSGDEMESILEDKVVNIKKKKDHFVVIEIFLILFIVLCGLCAFFLLSKLQQREKNYESLSKDYKALVEELDTLKTEKASLEKDIESFRNIDQTIESTKKEYFNHIKQLEDDILAGKSDKKIAYLTFDDGPYYNTYKIFDILDQYNVKATFFTTNTNGEYCFDNKSENCWIRYKEYVLRGHTIANHTYTHSIFRGLYDSPDSFMDAVIRQEELVKEKTGGYVTNIVRFPGGSVTAGGNKDAIIERLRARGYGWADWNSEDGDGRDLSSNEQAWRILTNTIDEKLEVVLLHDYNPYTTALLPRIIEYLQDNGYELYPMFYESHMVNK